VSLPPLLNVSAVMHGFVQLRYDDAAVFDSDTSEAFAAHFSSTTLVDCTKATCEPSPESTGERVTEDALPVLYCQ
jgi:hypothetical protein